RNLIFAVQILALLLLLSPTALAQSGGSTTATLAGTVKDTTGAVIPGATLQVKSPQTGLMRETTSTEAGEFLFSLLPPGEYDLKIEAEGFGTQTRHVTLTLGQTFRL